MAKLPEYPREITGNDLDNTRGVRRTIQGLLSRFPYCNITMNGCPMSDFPLKFYSAANVDEIFDGKEKELLLLVFSGAANSLIEGVTLKIPTDSILSITMKMEPDGRAQVFFEIEYKEETGEKLEQTLLLSSSV